MGAAAAAAASSQLAEQLQVAVLAKQPRMLARVLVCIASLRDPETRWTLRDVFVQAAAPERVFVAVAWQVDEEADAGLMRMAGGTRTAHFASQVSLPAVPAVDHRHHNRAAAYQHVQHVYAVACVLPKGPGSAQCTYGCPAS